ncbi:unnamed protein product [Phytophthora fragariaefolia]|uniref:Unnamed protein product n=1 Tax=Phytophthora fragariaefolia TaxID=1490495 RepID=A0A9W7D5J0_9STRA|nr:unnamed protein product [Phytophthora fragariaefolia]
MSLPAFNKLVNPLSLFMEKVYAAAGGRKKSLVRRVKLREVGWSEVELAALQSCKEALEHALTLAHPDPEKRLCVFTDASDEHWGGAITQVPQNHLHRDFADQHHEPLMMLSGMFSGGAKRWAIVEKEAYAIVETCKRADYLVRRPDGFSLFTDHRNLRYIFAPTTVSSAVPKYTADKLHRWSLLLMSLEYEIHDIAGDANVWADLLSRWGSAFTTVAAIRLSSLPVSPQLDDNFDWPTAEHIQAAQNSATDIPLNMQAGHDKVLRDCDGRVWLPDGASELQLRICIVGHFGAAGHRTVDVTLKAIAEKFVWVDMTTDVKHFVARCLHCASVSVGPPFPRPPGEALHAERPNELLHWDYLSMGDAATGEAYVLVLKDDASNYVWLLPTVAATAGSTYEALLDWFSAFGLCRSWVSDQGTHFKNAVIQSLQRALGAHHHFTTARCPWANGTVKVVMREVLRCCRSLLSEWRLAVTEWPRVIKIVQLVLNHSPSASLDGVAPVTAMTEIPAMNPVDPIFTRIGVEPATLDEVYAVRGANFEKVRKSLEDLHKRLSTAKQTARSNDRTKSTKRGAKMAQFAIADYVLYANVWNHRRSKLRVKWCGPARVVDTSSNWVFTIENLLTGESREEHASRLKFYADSDLGVTEDLLAHVAHNSEGHVVEELREARYDKTAKTHQLLVKWRGLGELENSWEPVQNLLEDVPSLVKEFAAKHKRGPLVKALADAHGVDI